MKKSIIYSVVVSGLLVISTLASAQKMQVASGSFGLLNPKIRLQYEMGLGQKASVGMAMHYYLVNWTGPKFEVFGRLYNKKHGNTEGFFVQGKIGVGNLKSLLYEDFYDLSADEQSIYVEPKKRWTTFGGGVATGYKFAVTDHFVIETLLGLHLYTPPSSDRLDYSSEYYNLSESEQSYYDALSLGEDIGWFLTTGLPLDLQIKFGYNF